MNSIVPLLGLYEEAPADEFTLGEPVRKELGDQPRSELRSLLGRYPQELANSRTALQQQQTGRQAVQQDIMQMLQATRQMGNNLPASGKLSIRSWPPSSARWRSVWW